MESQTPKQEQVGVVSTQEQSIVKDASSVEQVKEIFFDRYITQIAAGFLVVSVVGSSFISSVFISVVSIFIRNNNSRDTFLFSWSEFIFLFSTVTPFLVVIILSAVNFRQKQKEIFRGLVLFFLIFIFVGFGACVLSGVIK